MDKQQSGILNPAQMDAQVAKLQREGRLPPAAEFFKALNSTRGFYKSQMRKAMSGQIKSQRQNTQLPARPHASDRKRCLRWSEHKYKLSRSIPTSPDRI